MAQQGAALQNFNNELVRCLEELCERRQKLQKEIDYEMKEKQLLDAQMSQLAAKIDNLNASLAKKQETKAEYDRTIRESEAAYMKILESSQVLLNVVKRDAMSLQKAEHSVTKTGVHHRPSS